MLLNHVPPRTETDRTVKTREAHSNHRTLHPKMKSPNSNAMSGRHLRSANAYAFMSQLLLWAAPRCSSFAPVSFDRSIHSRLHRGRQVGRGTHSFLPGAAMADESAETKSANNQKEFSYAAILKAIDKSHYNETIQSCPYLGSETPATQDGSAKTIRIEAHVESHRSPATLALSDDAVRGLRLAAQIYFKEPGGGNNGVGIDRVSLSELLAIDGPDPEWKTSLNAAMMQVIYPSVRSGWPNHDAFSLTKDADAAYGLPVLTVTSASVFAGGGFPGAKAVMTTFERDAGLFVVHIDLGNDYHIENDVESQVMGALYMEALVDECKLKSNPPIVGPLVPGQMVMHQSIQRTAAIIVPSNIYDLWENGQSTVDSLSRTHILRAAERTRHYALRLILTTKNSVKIETKDGVQEVDIPQAPSEERSYRLRNYARFCREDRVRYLTLAGLLDLDDYENHLWLGFDYIARIDKPDYQCDLLQRLSDVNKAVFHLEKAGALCPTDSRIYFQLASAIGAKIDIEKRKILEGDDDQYHVTRSDEAPSLKRMAEALERSADLESAAVKLGVNGIEDLAICLNALAGTRCKLGEFDKAMVALDRWAECGSIRSALAIEDNSVHMQKTPSYVWIQTTDKRDGQKRNVAVKTVGHVPVFEPENIALLRSAADKRFALAAGIQTSRYTMQYEGMTNLLFLHTFLP
jgi:hypothetical protein